MLHTPLGFGLKTDPGVDVEFVSCGLAVLPAWRSAQHFQTAAHTPCGGAQRLGRNVGRAWPGDRALHRAVIGLQHVAAPVPFGGFAARAQRQVVGRGAGQIKVELDA